MANLVSMKSSGKRSTADSIACAYPEQQPYPWGLQISLENESIEKLGLNFAALSVGKKVTLTCEAEITNLSQESSTGGKDNKSLRLQIISMTKPIQKDRMKAGTDLVNEMRK